MRVSNFKRLLIIIALLTPTIVFAADEVITKAQELIKAGDYKSAYILLEPLEQQNAGNSQFDYVFGISALESGHVTRAVFALERVLIIEPNNAEARTEIAKAYLQLGEIDTAQSELKNVLDLSPPDDVKLAINRFMTQIDKANGNAATFNAYLEGTIGYDSNINSATNQSSIALPIFGGTLFNLNKSAQERHDGFSTLSGGLNVSVPINKKIALLGAINGSQKINWNTSTYDLGSFDYSLGVRLKQSQHTFTVLGQDAYTEVGATPFRRAYGLTGQWQYDMDDRNQVGAYLQESRLHYYAGQEIRDVDRTVGGLSYAHAFSSDLSPVTYVSAYIGKEDERASNIKFLGNDLYGVRTGGQLTLRPKLVLYANAAYENRNYGGKDLLFLKSRDDDQYEVSFGARYLPGYAWTIRPQFSYLKNNSNIAINEYDRYLLSLNFRHDFNW